MTDATLMHTLSLPILTAIPFGTHRIRATRHPAYGRLMMAKDVVEAIGYKVKTYTAHTLNGLKVSETNRITLMRGDFDISGKNRVPSFDRATFLTRAGLDEVVSNAAAKKVKTFGPWMVDVMENGVPRKAVKAVPGEAA